MRRQCCKSGSFVGKYRVISLISYGTSALVYEVEYNDQRYILKEFFPEGLHEREIITRKNGNYVKVKKSNFFLWKRVKFEFYRFIYIARRLSCCDDLNKNMTVAIDVIWKNNTVYAVYPYEHCKDWKQINGESYELILKRCVDIADIIRRIHKQGWLVVDIKSSNFLIDESGDIKLCDFDSMVKISQIKKQRFFKCSSETAPSELLYGDIEHVSEKSDLCSIAAMLCTKFTGKPYNNRSLNEIETLIQSWNSSMKTEFLDVLYEALDDNVDNRDIDVKEFGMRIRRLMRCNDV